MTGNGKAGRFDGSRVVFPLAAAIGLFCMATGPCYCPSDPEPARTCAYPGLFSDNGNYRGTLYGNGAIDPSATHPPCVPGPDHFDVWTFTPDCDGWVEITATHESFQSVSYLTRSCGDPAGTVACGPIRVGGLVGGTPYFYVIVATSDLPDVGDYAPSYGHSYSLTYAYTCGEMPPPPPPVPANDQCDTAAYIAEAGRQVVTGTTRGASATYPEAAPLGPDVWYEFDLWDPTPLRLELVREPAAPATLTVLRSRCHGLDDAGHVAAQAQADDGAVTLLVEALPEGYYALAVSGAPGEPDDAGPFTLTATFGPEALPQVDRFVVNELSYDVAGAGWQEFVELLGEPNRRLDGISVVHFSGADGAEAWSVDLSGLVTDAQGQVLLEQPPEAVGTPDGGTFEQPAGAVAVYRDRGTADEAVLDAVAYGSTVQLPAGTFETEPAPSLEP